MWLYSSIMFVVSLILIGISTLIYRGRVDLIHEYHQTNVKNSEAYGKAFAKALGIVALAPLVSGCIALLEVDIVWLSVIVLMVGMGIGIICIYFVQKKYNGGIF